MKTENEKLKKINKYLLNNLDIKNKQIKELLKNMGSLKNEPPLFLTPSKKHKMDFVLIDKKTWLEINELNRYMEVLLLSLIKQGRGAALTFNDGELDFLSDIDVHFVLFSGWYKISK